MYIKCGEDLVRPWLEFDVAMWCSDSKKSPSSNPAKFLAVLDDFRANKPERLDSFFIFQMSFRIVYRRGWRSLCWWMLMTVWA